MKSNLGLVLWALSGAFSGALSLTACGDSKDSPNGKPEKSSGSPSPTITSPDGIWAVTKKFCNNVALPAAASETYHFDGSLMGMIAITKDDSEHMCKSARAFTRVLTSAKMVENIGFTETFLAMQTHKRTACYKKENGVIHTAAYRAKTEEVTGVEVTGDLIGQGSTLTLHFNGSRECAEGKLSIFLKKQ